VEYIDTEEGENRIAGYEVRIGYKRVTNDESKEEGIHGEDECEGHRDWCLAWVVEQQMMKLARQN
jgi:hypothetical protein